MSYAATRTCHHCGQDLPLEQFRRRQKGSETRMRQCRECYNISMRNYRRARRNKDLHHFAGRVRRARSSARVCVLADQMMRRFGGPCGFAKVWKQALDEATVQRAGGQVVFSHLKAIVQLVEAASTLNRQPDVADLSDEQLAEEFSRGTAELIEDEPELAVAAAQRLGWTVIPPRDPPGM